MADVKKISEQIVEVGERLGNVADAANGKDRGGGLRVRWLVLPAAGAGLYALATSGAFTRQARDVVGDVSARASHLPDELMRKVHRATATSPSSNGRKSSSTRQRSRRRKATASSSSSS